MSGRLAPLNRDGNRLREAEGPAGHLVPKEQQAHPSLTGFMPPGTPLLQGEGRVISGHPCPTHRAWGRRTQSPGRSGQCPSRQTREMQSRTQLWDLGPRNHQAPSSVSQSAKAQRKPMPGLPVPGPWDAHTPLLPEAGRSPGCGHLPLSGASAGRPQPPLHTE